MGGGYGGDPYQMESFICIVRQLSTHVLVLERVEVSAMCGLSPILVHVDEYNQSCNTNRSVGISV